MNWRRTDSVSSDRRAATALEMALVAPALIPMLLAPLELGLYWWTRTTLQSVANVTARCVAISNPACTTTNTPAGYAATLAQSWSYYAVIKAADVTVSAATSCNGATGTFKKIVIADSQWSKAFHHPFTAPKFNITACYPT